jgi:3-dehydroquinate dehydratase-2
MHSLEKTIALINGPNLNWLGKRNPKIYGNTPLLEIEGDLKKHAKKLNLNLITFQSNHEGAIIDFIQDIFETASGIIINPGALMISGYSLRDALEDFNKPVIEIHISDISKRETFRRISIISDVCSDVITGQGIQGYSMALSRLVENHITIERPSDKN